MSKLIVEVCRVEKIEPHPNAEKMKIATVKGWRTCIKYDPSTDTAQFKEGDLCIYFPPDAVLPKSLYEDRLGIGKYLHELPKNEFGVRPEGRRVVATRLRGMPSYGVITNIDPKWGDDPNWEVGTNLVDHFGITKYEPPLESVEGDAERPHVRFYGYTSIENFGNYPNAIPIGDEVVMTEKIHGKNSRIGLVLDVNEEGNSFWNWMAGSHGVRRKEFVNIQHRYKVPELIEAGVFNETPKVGDVFFASGKHWKIEYLVEPKPESEEQILKVHVFQVTENGETVLKRSEFWEPLSDSMKNMMIHVRDNIDVGENKHSVVVYGEIFGAGVQDMQYGLIGRSFRLFDIAVNNQYLDFDVKSNLCKEFGLEMVPVLYRGPFALDVLELHTNGPTTICDPEKAGSFKGREGVVVTPVKEIHYCPVLNGRRIIKSVSADYLARKGGTEFH